MAAAVTLSLFIALVTGSLGQPVCFCFQQLVQSLFYASAHQFFNLTLDYFFVQVYNFIKYGLLSPFEMLIHTFILPEIANLVFFFHIFFLRILLYLFFPGAKLLLNYWKSKSTSWSRKCPP